MDAIKFQCYKNNACLSQHCVEPKELECGSYICSICADELTRFKCKHCAAEHVTSKNESTDIKNEKSPSEVEKLFGYCLKQYENVFNSIEELGNTMDYNRDNVFDEIDIKVESLKMDLDNLRDKLKDEFVQKGKEVKSEFSKQRSDLSRHIDEVKAIINDELLRTEESFKIHSNFIKEAYASIKNSQKKISFEINESTIDQSVIGSNFSALELFFNEYSNDRLKIVDRKLKDIFPLPNNKKLLVYKSKMAVYSNWSTLPILEKEMSLDHDIYKVCSNNRDAIFFSKRRDVTRKRSVVKLDLDFNVVKQSVFPFITVPLAIECHQEFIYCSVENQIFKLSRDLEVVETITIEFDFNGSFKISSMGIACLKFFGGAYGFYDVNKNFSLLSMHHSKANIASVVMLNDHFYLNKYYKPENVYSESFHYTQQHNKSMVYNNKGEFMYEFKICPENTDEYFIAQSSLRFDGCLVNSLKECLTPDYGSFGDDEAWEDYDRSMLDKETDYEDMYFDEVEMDDEESDD